ncbi:MAG: glycosidase [Candidatus Kaistia colombiensis]|nr:MAG: glycosidase [Kaistia sp.]
MKDFELQRIGLIMEPSADEPNEAEGVLNPAAIRGKDGQLYLFPRLVAKGNYSRIGIARVLFDAAGDPRGVERMGIALEPEADYELREDGGGCEDPRISYVDALDHYVMTYTALSPRGPRIAIAVSDDLFHWHRLGLATFRNYHGIGFVDVDDKDASVFSALVPDPMGRPTLGLIHRPLFPGTRPEEIIHKPASQPQDTYRECIWISYCRLGNGGDKPQLDQFVEHHRLICPEAIWERLKIGGGAPPILCRHGWLMIYHGVGDIFHPSLHGRKLCYSAGAAVLSKEHPNRVLYRSPDPVLVPDGPLEWEGTVDSVVFPTGIDRRDDLGTPDRFDVYYGMADDRIGVARLNVPEALPMTP